MTSLLAALSRTSGPSTSTSPPLLLPLSRRSVSYCLRGWGPMRPEASEGDRQSTDVRVNGGMEGTYMRLICLHCE